MSNKKEILELVRRYEQTIADNKSVYFDADQFSDIADYYDSIDDMESARELLEIGLKIHPENGSLLLKKAKLFVYDASYEQALELLDAVFSGYDFDLYMVKVECLLQLYKHSEAADLVAVILSNEPDEDLHTTLAELGFLYVEVDCLAEATNFFEESLKIDPENIEVLSDLSYAYEMLGDFDNAIAACNKMLDVDSYNYDAWINLGKLHSLQDNFDKAVDAFDFALTINDTDSTILKLKAHCLSLSNRPMEAMLIFRELLKESPDDTTLYLLLCECYSSLELFGDALECLAQYEEIEGETIELVVKRASVFFQMDKLDKALSLIDLALEKYGKQQDLLTLSADIKLTSEEFEEAEIDLKEAYMLESDSFDILDKLAIVSIKLEKYEEAIKYTEELLLLESDNISIRQRLTLLYCETDSKELFNEMLNDFDDEELMDLFKIFYTPQHPQLFDRERLIASLNEAREYRTLFKNLKY